MYTDPVMKLFFLEGMTSKDGKIRALGRWKARHYAAQRFYAPVPLFSALRLSADLHLRDDQLVTAIAAQLLPRFVELSFDAVDVVSSDNYFDVPAGRTVGAPCPLPEGWNLEQAREALRLRSLYDSFA